VHCRTKGELLRDKLVTLRVRQQNERSRRRSGTLRTQPMSLSDRVAELHASKERVSSVIAARQRTNRLQQGKSQRAPPANPGPQEQVWPSRRSMEPVVTLGAVAPSSHSPSPLRGQLAARSLLSPPAQPPSLRRPTALPHSVFGTRAGYTPSSWPLYFPQGPLTGILPQYRTTGYIQTGKRNFWPPGGM
jgi:hypothetical protein